MFCKREALPDPGGGGFSGMATGLDANVGVGVATLAFALGAACAIPAGALDGGGANGAGAISGRLGAGSGLVAGWAD